MNETVRALRQQAVPVMPGEVPVRPKTPATDPAEPRLVVAIPTTGRPGILPETVRAIARQDRLPDVVYISVASLDDIGDLVPDSLPFPVEILIGPKGATFQRNLVIDHLRPADILLLLDDDFLMAPDYLRQTARLFERNPDVVLATGKVLADGILGPGFDHAEGARRLEQGLDDPATPSIEHIYAGYGCNMALRAAPVLNARLRFDEALPLYSWLEDVDFSRRLARYGRLVRAGAMRGVHLGTKTGRTPGIRHGYSQIANPVYLLRKGTISRRHAAKLMSRNFASNLLRSFRPPPWVDYRGRLRGNLLAVRDVLARRDSPARILDMG